MSAPHIIKYNEECLIENRVVGCINRGRACRFDHDVCFWPTCVHFLRKLSGYLLRTHTHTYSVCEHALQMRDFRSCPRITCRLRHARRRRHGAHAVYASVSVCSGHNCKDNKACERASWWTRQCLRRSRPKPVGCVSGWFLGRMQTCLRKMETCQSDVAHLWRIRERMNDELLYQFNRANTDICQTINVY